MHKIARVSFPVVVGRCVHDATTALRCCRYSVAALNYTAQQPLLQLFHCAATATASASAIIAPPPQMRMLTSGRGAGQGGGTNLFGPKGQVVVIN